MGDEEERLLVWKLKVGLRVRRFNLQLRLRNRLFSSWKLHRLSFLVRFRKHHLKIDSQSKPKSRFRFLWSLVAFRRRRKQRVVELQVGQKKNLDEAFGAIWNRSLGFSNKEAALVGAVATLSIIIIIIILYFLLLP